MQAVNCSAVPSSESSLSEEFEGAATLVCCRSLRPISPRKPRPARAFRKVADGQFRRLWQLSASLYASIGQADHDDGNNKEADGL